MNENNTQKKVYSVQNFISDLRASRCEEVLFMLYERKNIVECEDIVCFGITHHKYLYDDNYTWHLEFCTNRVDRNSPLASSILLKRAKKYRENAKKYFNRHSLLCVLSDKKYCVRSFLKRLSKNWCTQVEFEYLTGICVKNKKIVCERCETWDIVYHEIYLIPDRKQLIPQKAATIFLP